MKQICPQGEHMTIYLGGNCSCCPPCPPPEIPEEKFHCASILASIALEEAGLAHILNAEGEKIQHAIQLARCPKDLLDINHAVKETIEEITALEQVLLEKMKLALRFLSR